MSIEEKKIAIDITRPRYERMGKCGRCGACCIGEDCEHLSWEESRAVCLIHEKDRPAKCTQFPANPPIVCKTCSYFFLDKWENKILKAGEV